MSLSEEDVLRIKTQLSMYKQVSKDITESYPVTKGFIGSSPEIHEKINYDEGKGMVCFFTRAKGTYTHFTGKINPEKLPRVESADAFEITPEGRLKISVSLEKNGARTVFLL